MNNILHVEKLGINFGGLRAVDNFYMDIYDNELVGLIGPNGAGKTTVFNMLTGIYAPSEGKIELMGESIINKKINDIAKMGIARTFQNIRLFNNLSVVDNIKVALNSSHLYSLKDSLFRTKKYYQAEEDMENEAMELLKIMHLDDLAYTLAANLPYGKQRELEIARALALKPKLLLLDEPAAGMNPKETLELINTIRYVQDYFKVSILLIEHDMNLVMELCKRITVLNYGMVLKVGSPLEIQNDEEVIRAYLGN